MFGQKIFCGKDKKNREIFIVQPETKNTALLVSWLNDAEVMRLLDPHAEKTDENKENIRLKEFQSSNQWCMWQITVEDVCVGAVWLHDIQFPEATAFTGIMIGNKNYWGDGIAAIVEQCVIKYAFSELNLEYLFAIIFEPNIASRRVFEKLGFKEYGIKPAAAFIDGKLYDGWEAVLSKKDWKNKNEQSAANNR
ncbi:MAG: GNAT family N-acetyltransferase [Patescibacteria group bacterium]|jgi:RimJ/RimL family protein N-acetyltransferase